MRCIPASAAARRRRPPPPALGAIRWAATWVGLLLACTVAVGCGGKLPEPQSPAAQLYVKYCSGSGCHGPIPPQRDVARYWDLQTDRMLVLMREQGFALPSPAEEQAIRDYLHKHAAR